MEALKLISVLITLCIGHSIHAAEVDIFKGIKLYAEKYAKDNIRINNILPGFIDSLPVKEEFLKRIPLKRYGKVSEISSVVEMLSSDGGAYITGQNINVDGGRRLNM